MNANEHGVGDDAARLPGGRLALALTAVWGAITFVPPLFARELGFEVFGLPFALWVAAQGAPIVYVLLVWICERRSPDFESSPGDDGDGH